MRAVSVLWLALQPDQRFSRISFSESSLCNCLKPCFLKPCVVKVDLYLSETGRISVFLSKGFTVVVLKGLGKMIVGRNL